VNLFLGVVHVVKNAEAANAKLPNGRDVLKLRRQALKALATARRNRRLMRQVFLDCVNHLPLIVRTQLLDFFPREFVDLDLIRRRFHNTLLAL
jgi:hypothetical protein